MDLFYRTDSGSNVSMVESMFKAGFQCANVSMVESMFKAGFQCVIYSTERLIRGLMLMCQC